MDKKTKQTLQLLGQYASEGKTICYSDLYEQIKLNWENPSDRNRGSNILEEVSHITMKKNETMISAIATLKEEGVPADGFYEFATRLNLLEKSATEKEKLSFWVAQVKKVFQSYNK